MAGYILFMSTATKENEEEFKSVDVWTVNPLIRLTERELRAAAAASTAAEFLQSLCVAARPRPHTHTIIIIIGRRRFPLAAAQPFGSVAFPLNAAVRFVLPFRTEEDA